MRFFWFDGAFSKAFLAFPNLCLRSYFPVDYDKVYDFRNRSDRPGENIEQIERLYGAEMGENRVDPENTEDTGAHDDDDCRNDALSKTSGCSDRAVHKGGYGVGQRHDRQTLDSGVHDRCIARKQRQEGIAQQIQSDAQHKPYNEGIQQADQIAL